jgi:isopentenyldiphosphate isomerase
MSAHTTDEEWFDLVDETGRVTGRARRRECHGNPALMHPVVHVMVRDAAGRIFLQKRSIHKDIQPGRWDTAVGGHMRPGEAPEAAARREMCEELGRAPATLYFCYQYVWRSSVETELVRTYCTVADGPFRLAADEIDEGRFWTPEEIRSRLGADCFTPNFEQEFERFIVWCSLNERVS